MHERSYNPHMISVLMVADNDADAIRMVIRQFQEQTYPYWELIIVDNSSDPQIARMLNNLANQEPRLDVLCQSSISHFVALEIAQGRARGAYTLTTESSYRFNPHVLQELYTAATALGPVGSSKAADIVIAHMKTANSPIECKKAFGAKPSALSRVFEESQLPYLTSMSGKLCLTRILNDSKHGPEVDGECNFVDYCFETAKNVTYAQEAIFVDVPADSSKKREEDIAASMDKLTQERQALMALAQHLGFANSKKVQKLISRYLISKLLKSMYPVFDGESQLSHEEKENFIVKILSNSVAHLIVTEANSPRLVARALLGAILSTTAQARYAYAQRAVWYARFMCIPLI